MTNIKESSIWHKLEDKIQKLYSDTYSEIMKIRWDAVWKILNKDWYIKVWMNDIAIQKIDDSLWELRYLWKKKTLNEDDCKEIISCCIMYKLSI